MGKFIFGVCIFVAYILVFFLFTVIGAVPTWLVWNWLAPKYLAILPAVWLNVPFWEMWGIIWLLMVTGGLLFGGVAKQTSSFHDGVMKSLNDN